MTGGGEKGEREETETSRGRYGVRSTYGVVRSSKCSQPRAGQGRGEGLGR